MQTVTKQSDMLPGYVKLIVIPVRNISSIADNLVNVISYDDVFLIQSSIESLHHTAKQIDGEQGKYYEHSVSAVLHGYTHAIADQLEDLSIGPVVVLMQTDDASWIRLGETDNALSFTADFDTERPGYDILITGELPYKSMPNEEQIF